jgi:membrane associated rhomboid family serine protease
MGTGRELGLQLRSWMESGSLGLDNGQALANRLVDALGAEEGLKGPVRDLASQPLLRQLLRRRGEPSLTAVEALTSHLARTYTPAVLAELHDLIEAATGITPPAPPTPATPPLNDAESESEPGTQHPATHPLHSVVGPGLGSDIQALGAGLALAASFSLVLAWAAGELDQALFDRWRWSGGVVLALSLALVQALSLGPLRRLRRRGLLNASSCGDPRRAWCWISSPWIHGRHAEAMVNVLLLLVLLGPSPLSLADVVLRYGLTSLATTALAALLTRRLGVSQRQWCGATGAIAALISLAAILSLLRWQELGFRVGSESIPAWVLLVVYGALQLGWQLPRSTPTDHSRPIERLWCSTWWWGSLLGLGWGLATWGSDLAQTLLKARPGS